MSSGQTSSNSSGGGASTGGGAVSAGIGSVDVDTGGLTKSLNKASGDVDKFATKVKKAFDGIKSKVSGWAQLFTPAFSAWKTAFSELNAPISESFTSIGETFTLFMEETLAPLGGYLLEDFIPSIVNSFSTNFAPVFTDVASFAVKQLATDFQWACEQIGVLTTDILQPALESVKTICVDVFNAIGEEWNKSGGTLLTKFEGFINSIKTIWENLYKNILKPVWDVIKNTIDTVWKEHLEPLWRQLLSFFSKVGECVMTLWNNLLSPIVNWIIQYLAPVIVNVVNVVMGVVKTIVGVVSDVIKAVLKYVGGLLDFITGVFSGDWEKAWQGMKDSFSAIWDAIWAICKGVVNLIIDGINALWAGIYTAISSLINGIGGIAGAIGSLFGQDWNFKMPAKAPLIPKLAAGGIVTGETLARIGEGGKKEAVLPLEQNTGWMDTLADRIASRQAAPSKIVLMLDGKELGYAAINSINNITRQTGELKLALV